MRPQYMAVDVDSVIQFDDECQCAMYCIKRGMAFVAYYSEWAKVGENGWYCVNCDHIDIGEE